jgi:hypothetical protein
MISEILYYIVGIIVVGSQWIIVLLLVLIVLLLAGGSLSGFAKIQRSILCWWFLRENKGHTILVATSRSGWYDFIKDNVIPVLPAGTKIVWFKKSIPRRKRHGYPINVIEHLFHGISKPFLIQVHGKPDLVELHHHFQLIKKHSAGRDSMTLEQVKGILNELGIT